MARSPEPRITPFNQPGTTPPRTIPRTPAPVTPTIDTTAETPLPQRGSFSEEFMRVANQNRAEWNDLARAAARGNYSQFISSNGNFVAPAATRNVDVIQPGLSNEFPEGAIVAYVPSRYGYGNLRIGPDGRNISNPVDSLRGHNLNENEEYHPIVIPLNQVNGVDMSNVNANGTLEINFRGAAQNGAQEFALVNNGRARVEINGLDTSAQGRGHQVAITDPSGRLQQAQNRSQQLADLRNMREEMLDMGMHPRMVSNYIRGMRQAQRMQEMANNPRFAGMMSMMGNPMAMNPGQQQLAMGNQPMGLGMMGMSPYNSGGLFTPATPGRVPLNQYGMTPFGVGRGMIGMPGMGMQQQMGNPMMNNPYMQAQQAAMMQQLQQQQAMIAQQQLALRQLAENRGYGALPPGTNQPGTSQPGTTQPGTTQPGTTQPGTTQPTSTTALNNSGNSNLPSGARQALEELRQRLGGSGVQMEGTQVAAVGSTDPQQGLQAALDVLRQLGMESTGGSRGPGTTPSGGLGSNGPRTV